MEGVNTTASTGVVGQGEFRASGTFQGKPCFDCPDTEFDKYRVGKKFKATWKSMLGKTEFGRALTQHVKDNNIKDFIVQNKSGIMMNIRRQF